MGASQRRKGATGEREFAQILSDQMGFAVKRNIGQSRDGGDDITVCQFRFEVKRRKGIAVHEWIDQAARASGPSDIPVVACPVCDTVPESRRRDLKEIMVRFQSLNADLHGSIRAALYERGEQSTI